MAIPRLAEQVGVTPRVLRYWEEQGLISPSLERGRLRYAPTDLAIARLIKRLLDAGIGIDGIRMLRTVAERDIRSSARAGDHVELLQAALRLLYERKAFQEATGMREEQYPDGRPPGPPPPPHGRHGPDDPRHPHDAAGPRPRPSR